MYVLQSDKVSPPQIDGLVQACSISIVNALDILQSCIKPSEWNINITATVSTSVERLYTVQSLSSFNRFVYSWINVEYDVLT